MTSFDVAHVREQGQQMIIVFVGATFGRKTTTEQNNARDTLQGCARAAGLAGTVVPVWDAGGGRMGFLAPSQWQGFFRTVGYSRLVRSINKKLTCG
ncbi:hypothetical protein [Rhodopirellula sp. P2]|uniref:hypothetical protein n=1 Tax=Rhodopirellula sp. P2 TaxID=2127060 RepID=UPI002368C421|nr:hypothetical protein [Rhodopirellula sp. P2]WDQ17450.1 hypothetical protein PSR62_02585 [Rhodopirellula sp. P2]